MRALVQWRIQERGPGGRPPSFLDQTEQNFLETAPPPPLDPALPLCAMYTEQIYREHVISFSNKFRINK